MVSDLDDSGYPLSHMKCRSVVNDQLAPRKNTIVIIAPAFFALGDNICTNTMNKKVFSRKQKEENS